ncbi:MAG TPA: polyhydroxyalkanoate synthesis regulator DNA-binding domain-containing protein, partial [Turneriella sp.]|nr:polyhydroxyalkanoate synthesis regulator DNA-binding domain-containing protein [Turneriella sp.]
MKLIKRYANRRLYDPETSRTITLDEVAQYVRDGIDIKVVDNTNGEDITRKVLGQTFLK